MPVIYTWESFPLFPAQHVGCASRASPGSPCPRELCGIPSCTDALSTKRDSGFRVLGLKKTHAGSYWPASDASDLSGPQGVSWGWGGVGPRMSAGYLLLQVDGWASLALVTTKAQVHARHLGRQAPRHPDEVRAASYL